MPKKILLALALGLTSLVSMSAQKWGYATLIARQNNNSVQLLDTNNVVIKQWSNLSGTNAYSAYLMEGGFLWRTVKAASTSLNGGGVCGRVQKLDWNGNVLFDYTISDANQVSHHDICPLPNGNVMLIVYERKTAAQVQAAGATINAERWSEKIVELKPTGTTTAQIVWQWNLWDHLVQNLYPAKANYQASIVNHPELLNINYKNTGGMADWVHMNGIDYNPALNQIVVSSHNLNEMWVIDHSTTTAEAAGHTGGTSGKGGDFLYRWGNPAAYGATGATIFNVMHDAHWVPADCPRAGWLGAFNNQGVSNSISAIDLFQPVWNGSSYTLTPGQAYQPATYGYRHQASGYSSNMGSSQQLPNGNMLICLATAGRVYEINANGTQIWQYTATGAIPQAKRYSRCYIENPTLAVATPNPATCAGGSVQLNVTPTATNVNTFSYQWAPANSLSSATVQNPLISGITTGSTYTITVTTANGCTATASIPVSITPAPAANAGPDVTVNTGQSTTLSASGGSSYSWNTGANTAEITVTPAQTTTYTVTVTNTGGCTATDEVTVTVNAQVSAIATTSAAAFCPGGSARLSVAVTGGNGNYTYAWSSTPAGFGSTEQSPVASPSVSTVYHVTVSDGNTQTTTSVAITVHPLPAADAGPDVTIIIGQTASLKADGGDSYLWSNGSTGANIQVKPDSNTTYSVTVTSPHGCTATDEVSVLVKPAVSLSISANQTNFCKGGAAQLTATATAGTGQFTYTWYSDPAGFSSTDPIITVTPELDTRYFAIANDGVNSDTAYVDILVFPSPNVNAGNDVSMLIGTSVTLTATGAQGYSWSNGVNGKNNTVSPVLTTTYTVTATNIYGCTATDEVTVTVTGSVLSAVISSSDLQVCAGAAIRLSAVASGGTGNYQYEWSADGVSFSTQQRPTVTPAAPTTFTVKVTDGISTVEGQVSVNVLPVPTANAGADQQIRIGQSATLTATGGGTYHWNTGEQSADITVTPTQTTTYTVTVTGDNGCSASDAVTVVVDTRLPLEGSVSASDDAICFGDVVQLQAKAAHGNGPSYTYAWTSNPAGFTSNLPDPFINPEENTRYTVVISDGISTLSLNIDIVVHPLAPQPQITANAGTLFSSSPVNNMWFYYGNPVPGATAQQFTPTLSGSYQVQVIDQNGCPSPLSEPYEYIALLPLTGSVSASVSAICFGDVLQLLATASNGTGQYTYLWSSVPAGFSSTLADPFVNPEENTRYVVAISDGLTVITRSIDIVVHPLAPQPQISLVSGSLVSSSATNNQWFYYGNPVPGATGQQFTPTQTGSYQVQVLDANGCFSPLSEPYEFIVSAAGEALPDDRWMVVPNPASESFRLLGDFDRSDYQTVLVGSTGRQVLQSANTETIDVSNLPAGMYWLRLFTMQGTGVRKVLIVR